MAMLHAAEQSRPLQGGQSRPANSDVPESAPLAAGDRLPSGYTVVAHLRRGRNLDVYDVWSEDRGCRCVAKTLRADRLERDRARDALLREGRLLKELTHPHLVRAYEVIDSHAPVVVLETLAGETLGHIIDRRKLGLAPREVAFLGQHLCSAISYLHRHAILHLDLKPSNIVSAAGITKLLDLSIARAPGYIQNGVGTAGYMAPEQAGEAVLSAATDVWGIGAVMFVAVTRRRPPTPRVGPRGVRAPRRRVVGGPRNLISRDLWALIVACLEPQPDDRPDLAQLRAALTSVS